MLRNLNWGPNVTKDFFFSFFEFRYFILFYFILFYFIFQKNETIETKYLLFLFHMLTKFHSPKKIKLNVALPSTFFPLLTYQTIGKI
jgi:hypothetical protein